MSSANRKVLTRFISVVFILWAVAGLGFASFLFFGCAEECLAWGENCSQSYLMENYGTTDIYCCEGQCADHGAVVVTCGSYPGYITCSGFH